jgi:hypothetical protein
MSLQRRSDWQSRFASFLISHRHHYFSYGTWDCGLFVADAIQAMTDQDLAAPFRGKYSSSSQVRKAIRKYAGSPSVRALAEQIAIEHKMPEVKILRARRGDLVLFKRPRDYSFGLVDLNGRDVIVISSSGLSRLPVADAFRAWKVG